jgi:hypothetical protein
MFNPHDRPGPLETVPGWWLVVCGIGLCVFVALGLNFYFSDHSTFGLFMAVWAGVITPIAWWQKLRRARSLYDKRHRKDDRTGETLAPPSVSDLAAARDHATRWTGAADMPTPLGRMTTTFQVAVLEIIDGMLILRLRPDALMRGVLRAEPLMLRATNVEAVFPARGRLRLPAIGIRPVDGPPSYFLTAPRRLPWYFGRISGDRPAIVAAIESAGFPVAWEERTFSRA